MHCPIFSNDSNQTQACTKKSSKLAVGRLRDFFIDCCGMLCFVILTTTAAVPFPFETFVKKVSKIFQIQFYR